VITPLTGVEITGTTAVGNAPGGPDTPSDGVTPVLPAIVTPLDVLIAATGPVDH
jgi:hypothetical protein